MNNIVEKYLKEFGPCLTSDAASHLVEILGLKPATARKRVSRAEGKVKRLAYITFPKRARFLYHEKDFGSPIYWERLVAALLETNSAYGHAIAAIQLRGGIIPENHFAIACGSPLKQLKRLSPETVFERLQQAQLLQKKTIPGLGECVTLAQADGYYDQSVSDIRARLITEAVVLAAVRDWLRNLGFVSYDRVSTREEVAKPTIGTCAWDLTAPSYLSFMSKFDKKGNPKPGFVACDILLGHTITEAGIRPFINKCKTLRNLKNIGPCMQIFVADNYSKEAFVLAKKSGIIPATPINLFGKDVADGLIALTAVLKQAAQASVDPEAFEVLFKKLGKIEGAANQIRGTLFEFIAAHILRKTISSHVLMNRTYKTEVGDVVKETEADVICINGDVSALFVECKGYSPYGTIPDDLFMHWLNHQVPVLFKVARLHPDWKNLQLCFEFWATGALSEDALDAFQKAQATINPRKYTIDLKRGPDILDMCKKTKDKSLIAAFQGFYFKK